MALLDINEVSVGYGKISVLHDISIQVNQGEIATVVGANGAGKSTLLRTISGILRCRSGSIHFDGESITRLPIHDIVRRGISQVPEGRAVLSELTVHENLRLGAYVRGSLTPRDSEQVLEWFPALGSKYNQLAGTLSGGEQQMLSIARSLLSRPKLLLVDELSLGLSPRITREIMDVLVRIKQEAVTILLVEQNVNQALRIADRMYLLVNGRLGFQGTPQEFSAMSDTMSTYLGTD